jgi:predicted ribosomally synthesized peptide with nif11-like leader
MSEEQLSAFLAKLKDDTGLQEKLQGAADFDAVLAIAKDSGFDVSKAALLGHQANQPLELSDEELAGVAGGQAWDGGTARVLQAKSDSSKDGCQTRPVVNLFDDVQ